MPRKLKAYLEDIRESIDRINSYTNGMKFEDFESDQKTIDAVINNLENIGEAVKNIPDDEKSSGLNWQDIAGFRDILVHQYFRADDEILWDIIENELPELEKEVEEMINK